MAPTWLRNTTLSKTCCCTLKIQHRRTRSVTVVYVIKRITFRPKMLFVLVDIERFLRRIVRDALSTRLLIRTAFLQLSPIFFVMVS